MLGKSSGYEVVSKGGNKIGKGSAYPDLGRLTNKSKLVKIMTSFTTKLEGKNIAISLRGRRESDEKVLRRE